MSTECQQTFEDLAALHYVQRLNPLQVRILKLLALGDYTQAEIGRRLNVSRQYVNQIVQKFQKFNLLQKNGRAWTVTYRTDTPAGPRPHREDYKTREKAEAAAEQARKNGISPTIEPTAGSPYNATYSVNPTLKKQIDRETGYIQYTNCRVHNIRRSYPILRQSGPVATDPRTGFEKSWEMRGGTRYKYFFPGKGTAPNITIDVHPGTLTAYPDRGQTVTAESIQDAEELTRKAIEDAIALFTEKQRR
ncbi:MAG: helix-turn-helix domain-containing protein, partial [Bacilli bacterium]